VVTTNKGAIKLWTDLGFSMVGTLPQALKHKDLGFVDAVVMYKLLEDQQSCCKRIYWRET
jgi:L-amino acid N-acyltransferase YncA